MASVKVERLNHLIQQEISSILMSEVRDEELKFVTITGCDTTSDYSFCKVYFTFAALTREVRTSGSLHKPTKNNQS